MPEAANLVFQWTFVLHSVKGSSSMWVSLRCEKCLFTNIQKQENTLKVTYFKKIQTLRENNSRGLRIKNFLCIIFYEHKHLGKVFKH